MPSVTIQPRVSPELKKQAEAVFATLGLSELFGLMKGSHGNSRRTFVRL